MKLYNMHKTYNVNIVQFFGRFDTVVVCELIFLFLWFTFFPSLTAKQHDSCPSVDATVLFSFMIVVFTSLLLMKYTFSFVPLGIYANRCEVESINAASNSPTGLNFGCRRACPPTAGIGDSLSEKSSDE